MQIGDKVQKISGSRFSGVVVARFRKIDNGQDRFVVECIEPSTCGLLQIFRESQLRCENIKQM